MELTMPTFASSEFSPQSGMVNPEKLVYFGLAPQAQKGCFLLNIRPDCMNLTCLAMLLWLFCHFDN